jgi:PAS domain S-box-containing protein
MAPSGRTNCTILLIDDELAGLQLRKRVLESVGYRALSATNGDEGMELFRFHDVDVVVTDHLLGRATAAGIAASMKRLKPYVPIVSFSGTTNAHEALGYADHIVGKGQGPEALITALDEILSHVAPKTERPVIGQETPADLPSQALLAAIIEDSSDAILSKTLDGTVTSWNHAAEMMYGYSRQEMIGELIAKLLPPDRPDEVVHILGRLKRGERILHFETVRVAKDGRKIDVALTISPIRWRRTITGSFHNCARHQRTEARRGGITQGRETRAGGPHGDDSRSRDQQSA